MSTAAQTYEVFFEQRLFARSPLGTFATSFLIFAFALGSFVLLSLWIHYPLTDARGMALTSAVMPAIALSLLLSTVLGMQRYTRVKEQADQKAFALIVSDGKESAVGTLLRPESATRLNWAGVAGTVSGMALTSVVIPHSLLYAYPAMFAWHATLTVALGALFGRGVVTTIRTSRAFSHVIEHDLEIDLIHIDRLEVIGRHCARNALVWFTAAAVVCLFFVGGGVDATTIALLAVCAGMGLWIFLRPLVHVHTRIRAVKLAELDRVRDQIATLRDEAVHDDSAATRLQGLLAYEARMQSVHEWPFDQSTMVRVGAYVLIPAIPWLGKAALSDIMQRLAH